MLIDCTGDDALLNHGEIALDLLPSDRPTLGRLYNLFRHSFLQPWHLGHEMQWFDGGFSIQAVEQFDTRLQNVKLHICKSPRT
jgi:hypothetical protein